MKRLKTILLFDSSKFIHLALVAVLYLLTRTSYLAIVLLIIELVFLFKKSRNLLIYSLILMAILNLRLPIYNNFHDVDSGVIIAIDEDRLTISKSGKYYLYVKDSSNLKLGMEIAFEGQRIVSDRKNIMFGFDYQRFLKANNIVGQYNVTSFKVIGQKKVIQMIPETIKVYFDEYYDDDVSTYMKLFILGDKEGLDEDIVSGSRKIGISHLFAVSGMHLGLIVVAINAILKRFYLKTKTKNIILVLCLVAYNIMTGFLLSIMRASLLSICLLRKSDNNFSNTDYLTFIMIGFLIYNPYLIYNIGFVLSFLISFSIILGSDIFGSEKKVIQVMKIGALANLVSLPIIMNLNGSFGIFNIFYNVLFVYFVSVLLLPMAFITLIIPLSKLYQVLIIGFEDLIELSASLNFYLEFHFSFAWVTYIYYLSLLGYLVFFKEKKKQYFTLGCIISIFLTWNYHSIVPSTFVRMIDVNQAEAIHIHHNTCDILIDTGKSDDYDSLIKYFQNNNIDNLDYLVITHMHDDHYGEASDIINNLDVKHLLTNQISTEFFDFKQTVLHRGDSFGCGNLLLTNINESKSENENNNSIVLYGRIGIDYWLFTGDIEKEVEAEIIHNYSFELDVLKVAHHGSDTSSSPSFLDAFKSELALISVGANYYGHPSEKVLGNLKERNYRIFRTDEFGTITFSYIPILNVRIIDSFYFEKRRAYYF
ncbi:MAG: DNA internalization-related competence protein ComEC/Rec2 [Tenericutes bacterium HGW-Tenericutes-5]|nr:MAG: DNA internalization-related competence protein ComEC/Rec2 [Tenericutes bacterium HGW-Tenericutes-5]